MYTIDISLCITNGNTRGIFQGTYHPHQATKRSNKNGLRLKGGASPPIVNGLGEICTI